MHSRKLSNLLPHSKVTDDNYTPISNPLIYNTCQWKQASQFQDWFWLLLHWFLVYFWFIFHSFLIDSSSISEIMNDKWCLPNEQWSMLNDEWWWMMNDEWWMKNDEWWTMNDWVSHELRMMNDESRMINDEWWLPSSKCRTEKSHPFISKVSQKLDYCLSTHIRLPSQPRCLTGSTESVYFTKGKTEFQSNLRKSIRSIYSEGSTKVRRRNPCVGVKQNQ